MINDLKQNLKEIINKSPWMNKNSKSEALLKLDNITTKVGYLQNFNFDRIDDFYQDVSKKNSTIVLFLNLLLIIQSILIIRECSTDCDIVKLLFDHA